MKKKTIILIGLLIITIFIGCVSTDNKNNEPLILSLEDLKSPEAYKPGTKIIINSILTYSVYEPVRTAFGYIGGFSERIVSLYLGNTTSRSIRISNEIFPLLDYRIEKDKYYNIHFTVMNNAQKARKSGGVYFGNYFFLDQIEDLLSIEDGRANEASKRAIADTAYWANRNPNNLDRSQYRQLSVSNFSFEMVAGNLPVNSKYFIRGIYFLTKPTETSYKFKDINFGITLNSRYNFVSYLQNQHFGEVYVGLNLIFPHWPVDIYVTVLRTGQYGECSIDIMDWPQTPEDYLKWR